MHAPGPHAVTGAAEPSGQFRIGISSWGTLPGFYPSGVKSTEKLAWFARFFSVVEVNVSFYRLVPPHTYENWIAITPADFAFDVKAFGDLTHFREPPPADAFAAFCASYAPLRETRQLGGVLFQFPPRFTNSPSTRTYLGRVAEAMRDDLTIVEFRNHSWLAPNSAEATFSLLTALGLAYAVADEPQIPHDTVPPLPAVTNPGLAYIRLHGRNADAWYRAGDSGDRYDYDYGAEELDEWAEIARNLAREAEAVHILFNNNAKGAGTRNALALGKLLGSAPGDAPELPPEQPRLFDEDDDHPPSTTTTF
ncbi:MAG: DUF72 domain-containing protein [Chloroflexota bacterium]|nr:DUF72 domain-containing protein [Chloroflexota bacterium]